MANEDFNNIPDDIDTQQKAAQRFLLILDKNLRDRVLGAGYACSEVLMYMEKYSRLPEYCRFVLSCQILVEGNGTPTRAKTTSTGKKDPKKEIIKALYGLDEYDIRFVMALVDSLNKVNEHSQEKSRTSTLLAEFRTMSGEAKALMIDLINAYKRTFHITFGAPLPGEEAA